MSDWYTFADDFGKEKTAIKLEIKKYNKNNQLCYYDSVDLTGKGFNDEQLNIFVKLFSSAGFKTEINKHTYFGIYDPSRFGELVEIYPTDEQLCERELRDYKLFNKTRKKFLGFI